MTKPTLMCRGHRMVAWSVVAVNPCGVRSETPSTAQGATIQISLREAPCTLGNHRRSKLTFAVMATS